MLNSETAVRALLLDADGVSIEWTDPFSHEYARRHGVSPEEFLPFFKGPFQEALRGKADLKDLIRTHNEIWRWGDEPEDILNDWFEHENKPNEPLISKVGELRQLGLPVYLATNQERYRTQYLRDYMFVDVFTDILASSEIGTTKNDNEFWKLAITALAAKLPDLKPADVMYFDDSEKAVSVASESGIDAALYESPEQVMGAVKQRLAKH